MSFAKLITSMTKVADKLVAGKPTDQFFVMRPGVQPDGRGGSKKTFAATTTAPYPCWASVFTGGAQSAVPERATEKRPVVYRRLVCASGVDVEATDRVTIVARDNNPEVTEAVISRVTPLGVLKEIICVQELAS